MLMAYESLVALITKDPYFWQKYFYLVVLQDFYFFLIQQSIQVHAYIHPYCQGT